MEIGIKGYAETLVDQSNVASSVGSGLLEVFSTPSMIASRKLTGGCSLSLLLFIRKRKKSARAFTNAVLSAMSAFWQRSGQSTKAETHRRFGAGR